MEAHPVLEKVIVDDAIAATGEEGATVAIEPADTGHEIRDPLTYMTEQFIAVTSVRAGQLDWHLAEQIVGRSDGIPTVVGASIKNAATSAASE